MTPRRNGRKRRRRSPGRATPRPAPAPGGIPPEPAPAARQWVAFLLVAALIAAAYVVVTAAAWQSRGWSDQGPLSYRAPAMAADARLVPDGVTAGEVAGMRSEYGCDGGDGGKVVGGVVDGQPYFAVYAAADPSICMPTFRDGRSGQDLDPDGDGGWRITQIAKAGGAWPWIGTVKTVGELRLGLAALVALMVVGGFLVSLLQRDAGTRFLPRAAAGVAILAAFALGFLVIDVVVYPDRLGATVVALLGVGAAWGVGGAFIVLDPYRSDRELPGEPLARAAASRARRFVVSLSRRLRNVVPRRRRGTDPSKGPAPATPGGETGPQRREPRLRVTPTSRLPHFDDVGGMDAVKGQLEDTLGLLLAFADEAEEYRITFNGILLHGPPGTGKTYLAKATAGEFGLSFVHVTAADLVSKYVGETARNVEEAFTTAAANVPCLLFFDEFDAIAARRDDDASAEDRRAVAQLLTSLERHRTLRDLVVIAATNDLERLDRAVVRPGRFDRHLRIDLPDAAGREAVLRAALRGRPAYARTDLTPVVQRTEGLSAASLAALVEAASLSAFRETTATGNQQRIGAAHLLAALEARGGRDRPTVTQWSWTQLVLPQEVLAELQQVQAMVEDPEQARRYGVRPPTGMLLAGPPGTGKTTIARVLAAQARCSFYPVTVADLTSKWVGESEATVARLFQRARENAPSIVFLDEIDGVAARRGAGSASHENRLLNQLLTEIDGLDGRGDVFVLAATNRPDTLDPALTRGGRLSRTLWVDLPDESGRARLLALHSARMPLHGVDLGALAAVTTGMSGADLEALCQQAAVVAMTRAAREGDVSVRPQVTHADFTDALATVNAARSSAASYATTPRLHLRPDDPLGGF